jgi:hypothetical protein
MYFKNINQMLKKILIILIQLNYNKENQNLVIKHAPHIKIQEIPIQALSNYKT